MKITLQILLLFTLLLSVCLLVIGKFIVGGIGIFVTIFGIVLFDHPPIKENDDNQVNQDFEKYINSK